MRIVKQLLGPLTLAILTFAGCHEIGHVDGPQDYGQVSGNIVGEIQYVDAKSQEIEIRSDAGRTSVVRYDNDTRVSYQQRDYPVANLEPGDYVTMRTQQGRDGRLFTDAISVREGTQSRGTPTATTDVRGTVTQNTPAYSSIAMETRSGQYIFVHDAQTRVRYRNAAYLVQSIQAGDDVVVRARAGASGAFPVADLITVTAKGRERSGPGNRLDLVEGRVEYIDSRRGTFEIRDKNNRLFIVGLQFNPPRAVSDRFNRLRNGDSVRIEGRYLNQDRFELENFL